MSTKKNQLTQTLLMFYDRPVAKVSSELIFTVLAVIFFAVFAIRPTLLTMSTLIKEIDDKNTLNQQLIQKIASLSTVQTQYLNSQERLKVLDTALPSSPNLLNAVLLIEKVASDNNLAILSLEDKQVPKEDPPGTLFEQKVRLSTPIKVVVTGSYPAISQFVEGLRNLRREMVVESVSFSLSDGAGKKQLAANVVISVQYFGLPIQ